jgi:hypothetical protein
MLDALNMAAAKADYDTYSFMQMAQYLLTGTDATERWTKQTYFMPNPFDKGKAWSFLKQ